MIEDRPLNRLELLDIINEAPDEETRNLKYFLIKYNLDAYNYFKNNSVYSYGLIINGKPIYFAYIVNTKCRYELFTVVNKYVYEQFSLFKYTKKNLVKALKEFSPIYATMEKGRDLNLRWTKRLGFKEYSEDNDTITLMIE